MPPVGPGFWSRQISIEMRIPRARDVALLVVVFTLRRVRQVEAAVDDDPIGVAEMRRQRRRIDQGSEFARRHCRVLASTLESVVQMMFFVSFVSFVFPYVLRVLLDRAFPPADAGTAPRR